MSILVEQITQVEDELVEAFARLIPQLNPAYVPPSRAALEAILSGGATELFVARSSAGGEIVGALALAVFSTPTGTHAWIEDVVVERSWRGQGIGAELSRAAIARAAARGAKAVDLTSRPAREAANRLYTKLGFELRPSNLYRYKLR